MNTKQIKRAIRNAEKVMVYVRLTNDDGHYFVISKAEALRTIELSTRAYDDPSEVEFNAMVDAENWLIIG